MFCQKDKISLFFKKLSCLLALSQGELLTIFTMLCLGSSMADMNVIETLVLSMGHASWYAMPENEWESLFFRYIPKWLTVMICLFAPECTTETDFEVGYRQRTFH